MYQNFQVKSCWMKAILKVEETKTNIRVGTVINIVMRIDFMILMKNKTIVLKIKVQVVKAQ